MKSKGILYGVGVGPGDPMLLTLKANEVIQQADVLAFITNEQGQSLAKNIAQGSITKKAASSYVELPLVMRMDTDRTDINQVYDKAAKAIAAYCEQGKQVAFLCEGDPLFYGSFAYLLARLANQVEINVIPGICSVHASAAVCKIPLGLLSEKIMVLSGRHSDEEILNALASVENIVIMKAGRSRAELVKLIQQAGRVTDTCYIEYATQAEQKLVYDITELESGSGPYFSMFLINANRDYH
ncbi:precorrin-2 C(20)-methyltransferase [Beggiatoa alba]|nr:precorrin-2 C(20)-methyltransferase [Beggiatoa alba]